MPRTTCRNSIQDYPNSILATLHRYLTPHAMRLTHISSQMMFVSGETGDVSAETTSMIEGIVQQQVMEMVTRLPPPSKDPHTPVLPNIPLPLS